MVEQVTGGRLPPEVLEQIVERTDGVPLFVELTKAVLELGPARGGAGATARRAPAAARHPLDTAGLAHGPARPPRAGPGGGAGRRRDRPRVLATAPGRGRRAAGGGARPRHGAARHHRPRLSRRGGPAQAVYLFKHALVQDGARRLADQPAAGSTELRRSSRRFPETAETEPELLAHHFGEAGLAEEAVDYHQRAGRRALARSAPRKALAQFGAALAQLQDLPRAEGRLRRSSRSGSPARQRPRRGARLRRPATGEAYRRAAELCEELGDARAVPGPVRAAPPPPLRRRLSEARRWPSAC